MLLADIYGTDKRVSGILTDLGLEQGHIDALKDDKLELFYENMRLAFECRFLPYTKGSILIDTLYRRYGLFGHKRETLEEIGNQAGLSRQRIYQLQKKAVKRLSGGEPTKNIEVVILLCACHTLKLDAMTYLIDQKNDQKTTQSDSLSKVVFYIYSNFYNDLKHGKYCMLVEDGEDIRYTEKQELEGHSDISMILIAVIEGLETLQKPSDIMVYSNALFGCTSIYSKDGSLRQKVPVRSANYTLKEKVWQILNENGHRLSNIADTNVKIKVDSACRSLCRR